MWNKIKTNKLVGEMWPNDADGLGWANAKTGQPPLLTAAGYKFVDGGRFPTARRTSRRRSPSSSRPAPDPQRRLHPAGLRELLAAGLSAGPAAQDRLGGQGTAVPGRDRGDRQHRLRPDHRDLVVAGHPSSRRSRARPASSSPTTGPSAAARSGRSRCSTTPSSRSSPTPSSAPPTSTAKRPSWPPSSTPTCRRSRGTSPGRRARR